VKGADSIARTADYAAKTGTGSFSRQFWTAGTDQKATTAEGSSLPTRAKIQGSLPQPAYPEFLRKNGVEGEVVVQFLVDETGRPDVSTLEVVRSPHDDLTEAVRRVISRIHFDPALTGGPSPKPRTEVVRISYLFKSASK
jgi:TonB family protein